LGLLAALAVILLFVLAAAYVRFGWWRMEAACTATPPGSPVYSQVEFGWSWIPPGFTCIYDNGKHVKRSFWF
jgi:hypothetical protein